MKRGKYRSHVLKAIPDAKLERSLDGFYIREEADQHVISGTFETEDEAWEDTAIFVDMYL